MVFKETKGILIPSSKEDVRMLNKVLEIVTQNQFIMEKDILELCKGDIPLCNKTKYCLIDTEAIIPATNWNGRYNKHPENTARYLDTGYYKALYEKHKQDEEKKDMEINKLKKDLELTQKQTMYIVPTICISLLSLIASIIGLLLK